MKVTSMQGQYAGFASRAVAFVLDTVIISLAVVLTSWLTAQMLDYFAGIDIRACPPLTEFRLYIITCLVVQWGLNLFAIAFPFLYLLTLWILSGQTIGHYLLGLRVVQMNGKRINLVTGILRILGYVACFLTLGLGFLLVLISDQRRGLQDRFARTCVIYAWDAQQHEPFLAQVRGRLDRRRDSSKHDQGSESAEI